MQMSYEQYLELRCAYKSLRGACLAMSAGKTSEQLQNDENYQSVLADTQRVQRAYIQYKYRLV